MEFRTSGWNFCFLRRGLCFHIHLYSFLWWSLSLADSLLLHRTLILAIQIVRAPSADFWADCLWPWSALSCTQESCSQPVCPSRMYHKCHLHEGSVLLASSVTDSGGQLFLVVNDRDLYCTTFRDSGFHPAVLPGAGLLFVWRLRVALGQGVSSILSNPCHFCHR